MWLKLGCCDKPLLFLWFSRFSGGLRLTYSDPSSEDYGFIHNADLESDLAMLIVMRLLLTPFVQPRLLYGTAPRCCQDAFPLFQSCAFFDFCGC